MTLSFLILQTYEVQNFSFDDFCFEKFLLTFGTTYLWKKTNKVFSRFADGKKKYFFRLIQNLIFQK